MNNKNTTKRNPKQKRSDDKNNQRLNKKPVEEKQEAPKKIKKEVVDILDRYYNPISGNRYEALYMSDSE